MSLTLSEREWGLPALGRHGAPHVFSICECSWLSFQTIFRVQPLLSTHPQHHKVSTPWPAGITGLTTARASLCPSSQSLFSTGQPEEFFRCKIMSVLCSEMSSLYISLRAKAPVFKVAWKDPAPSPYIQPQPLTNSSSFSSSHKGLLAWSPACLAVSCLGLLHLPFFSQEPSSPNTCMANFFTSFKSLLKSHLHDAYLDHTFYPHNPRSSL